MNASSSNAAKKTTDRLFDKSGATTDRLPGLLVLFEALASIVSSEVGSLCRSKAIVAADRSEKETVFEVLERKVGNLVVELQCKKSDTKTICVFDRNFVDLLAHGVFGGADDVNPIPNRATEEIIFTSIDKGLARKLCEGMSKGLDRALKDAVETEFCVERVEQIVDAQTLGKRNSELSTVRLRLQIGSFATECMVGFAQNLIQLGHDKFAELPQEEAPSPDPKWIRDLHVGLSTAPVVLAGILEEVELTLGDLGRLKVGGVIDLQGGGMGKILLESEGQKLFWCKVEQTDGKYVLEVEEPYQENEAGPILSRAV